ncbi:hypothetical protein [Vibrio rotiferianus]|nr:hypothetical protein [Vibrio rotiferianus]
MQKSRGIHLGLSNFIGSLAQRSMALEQGEHAQFTLVNEHARRSN